MTEDRDDLEPLDPHTARELFIDHKRTDCRDATVRNHKYRIKPFVRWCEETGIDDLNDLSGRDVQQYRLWRQNDGELNRMTLRGQMATLRVFLKWAASIEAVPQGFHEKVLLPQVGHEERRRDETLDSETAEQLLEYCRKYHYAAREHVVLALLWETGIRIGAAHAIDVDDIDLDGRAIHLKHRPREDTPLKNGAGGERPVAISPELAQLLTDFIDNKRPDMTDDYGREPLLVSSYGRLVRATIRNDVYRVTAPCFRGEPCPDCRQGTKSRCQEAVSPHAIRRGSITHFLANDVPPEIVSDRMNVGRDVLDAHYDKRTEEVKLEQRRGYLDDV
jgi:integrase